MQTDNCMYRVNMVPSATKDVNGSLDSMALLALLLFPTMKPLYLQMADTFCKHQSSWMKIGP